MTIAEANRQGRVDPCQLLRVPLRVLGEGGCASERTEVVGLLVHEQATNRVISIDRHLADGVDRQLLSVLVHANDSENLDGLGDVA
jgi:hypothetical protein